MPTNAELQSELDDLKATVGKLQLDELREILRRAGLLREKRPATQSDYVAFGSAKHALLLGLVEVTDQAQAKQDGYTVYVAHSGKAWRLDDEIAALRHYPGVQPRDAILVVLRQKVNEIESGAPKVPPDAPPMFNPAAFAG